MSCFVQPILCQFCYAGRLDLVEDDSGSWECKFNGSKPKQVVCKMMRMKMESVGEREHEMDVGRVLVQMFKTGVGQLSCPSHFLSALLSKNS